MKKVVVIGGAVIDLFAYSYNPVIMRDSNPGYLKTSFGGVGRNIAENLCRLGIDCTLITVLGRDPGGISIRKAAEEIGLKLSYVEVDTTPIYIAVMDEGRDNLVSIAAMDQIDELTVGEIQRRESIIREADLLVLDVNLSQETLDFVCGYAQDICIDCISSRKAMKLKTLLPKIHSIKMSLLEAELFTGVTYRNPDDLDSMSRQLQEQGVHEVFITLGEKGAYHSREGKASFIKAASVDVVNTTGAGDAFFAGAIYAKLSGLPPLPYATVNALINLQDEKAVSSLLTRELLEDTVRENKYQRG